MAAAVGKYAANKLLKKEMAKYKSKKPESGAVSPSSTLSTPHQAILTSPSQDPYFAMVEDPRKPGKFKQVKKQIPAYIPEHDAAILASVRKRAYRLDMCLFNFLGIRFGWEAVIGIVPAIGDVIGVMLALMVFKKCCQVEGGLDSSIKMRMMLNIAVDFVVGLVPFIGDLADAAFKCNTKNLRLLERTLDKKYKPGSGRDDRNLAGVDREKRRKNRQSGIYMPNDPPPATAFEDYSDDELRGEREEVRVQQPPPAYGGGSGRPRPDERRQERRDERRQETGSVRR